MKSGASAGSLYGARTRTGWGVANGKRGLWTSFEVSILRPTNLLQWAQGECEREQSHGKLKILRKRPSAAKEIADNSRRRSGRPLNRFRREVSCQIDRTSADGRVHRAADLDAGGTHCGIVRHD